MRTCCDSLVVSVEMQARTIGYILLTYYLFLTFVFGVMYFLYCFFCSKSLNSMYLNSEFDLL